MWLVDTSTAVPTPPAQNPPGTPGYFDDGNPVTGPLATAPGQDWFNTIQAELMAFLTYVGITPVKGITNQVLTAVRTLIANAITALNLGTAAFKAASNNSDGAVASVTGAVTAGHLAVFADNSGSIEDGGTIPVRKFTSGPLTVPNNGVVGAVAHGLGQTPDIFTAVLVNVNPEAGYATGDAITTYLSYSGGAGGGSSLNGLTIWANATQIGASIAINGIYVVNKSSDAILTGITPSNWSIEFNAFTL